MKTVIACLMISLAAGCSTPSSQQGNLPAPDAADQEATDAAMVRSISDTAVNNAIITQHTLFPYHFLAGSAEVNALGQRELLVLSEGYRDRGGSLNVRQGDAPAALYQERVRRVAQFLTTCGVKMDTVTVSDGPPGGSGMTSQEVITNLRNMEATKETTKGDKQTPDSASATKGAQ